MRFLVGSRQEALLGGLCSRLTPLSLLPVWHAIFRAAYFAGVCYSPPGNQNYAGVFIIWDRLFGTYRE